MMMMKLVRVALLLTLASSAVWAQTNVGEQQAEATLPFQLTTTATFELTWRIAFLPDGRMLVTEKIGPIWLVSPQGEKIAPLGNTPPVYWQGQNGMLGVYLSPNYATDHASISPISSRVTMAVARCWHAPSWTSNVINCCISMCCGARCPKARGATQAGRSFSRPMVSICS